jgi:hypothetical protein
LVRDDQGPDFEGKEEQSKEERQEKVDDDGQQDLKKESSQAFIAPRHRKQDVPLANHTNELNR